MGYQRMTVEEVYEIPLQEIILDIIYDPKEPLKPKSVYQVLKVKRNLDTSYETFKNFIREKGPTKKALKPMIRIELPPGLETQIDYGKVGLLEDSATGRNRVV